MAINKTLKVILVEPAGPINVGSVARLCENFSVDELRLVSPRCDYLDQEARKMSVRGVKILEKAKVNKALTIAISNNPKGKILKYGDHKIILNTINMQIKFVNTA